MPTTTTDPATLDDLYGVEGKAELVAGRIVRYEHQGFLANRWGLELAPSLQGHAASIDSGVVMPRSLIYALHPPLRSGRASISPDISFYRGPRPADSMGPIVGPPTFAVEIRERRDHGPGVVLDRQQKRADYFEAGTAVVWDVDPEARVIRSYRGDPATPVATFHPGDAADAEPAVPGWRVAVADLFQ